MVTHSEMDFFGGYDHAVDSGVVHVANHHIAPGKKQWTWGNHEFGYAWDRSLTDSDGPYVELMAGVYTDNQPDFSFLAPGETKNFSQYWYPVREIGPPQAANLDAALSMRLLGDEVYAGICVTRSFPAPIFCSNPQPAFALNGGKTSPSIIPGTQPTASIRAPLSIFRCPSKPKGGS